MPRPFAAILAIALLLATAIPAGTADSSSCQGLPNFESELIAVGQQWLEDTQQAGVSYTADPFAFDAADWTTFAELAVRKRDNLQAIEPPDWLADWLAVQIDATTLQSRAGEAAAKDGISALESFGDDFIDLVRRQETVTSSATKQCAAFAAVATTWHSLNRDFEPAPATPRPDSARYRQPIPVSDVAGKQTVQRWPRKVQNQRTGQSDVSPRTAPRPLPAPHASVEA